MTTKSDNPPTPMPTSTSVSRPAPTPMLTPAPKGVRKIRQITKINEPLVPSKTQKVIYWRGLGGVGLAALAIMGGALALSAPVVAAQGSAGVGTAVTLVDHAYPDDGTLDKLTGPIPVNDFLLKDSVFHINAVNTMHNNVSIYWSDLPTSLEASTVRLQGLSGDPEHELRLDLELLYQIEGTGVVSTADTYLVEQLYGEIQKENWYLTIDEMRGDQPTMLNVNQLRNNASPVLYIFPNWEENGWLKVDYGRCVNSASFQRYYETYFGMGGGNLTCMIENRPDGQGVQFAPMYHGKKLEVTAAEDAANDERFWHEHHIDYALITIKDVAVRNSLEGLEAEVWRQDAEILELERRIVNAEHGHSNEDVVALRQERAELEAYQAEYLAHFNPVREYFLSATSDAEKLAAALEQIGWLENELNLTFEHLFTLEQTMQEQTEQIINLEEEIAQLEAILAEKEAELVAGQELSAAQAADIAAQKEELLAKEAELSQQKADLAANQATISEQEAQLAERQEQIEQLTTQLTTRQEQIEQLTAQLAERQEQNKQLTTQLATRDGATSDEVQSSSNSQNNGSNQDATTEEVEAPSPDSKGDTAGDSGADKSEGSQETAIDVPQLGGVNLGLPWWFWMGVGGVITGFGFEMYLYFTRRRRAEQASK